MYVCVEAQSKVLKGINPALKKIYHVESVVRSCISLLWGCPAQWLEFFFPCAVEVSVEAMPHLIFCSVLLNLRKLEFRYIIQYFPFHQQCRHTDRRECGHRVPRPPPLLAHIGHPRLLRQPAATGRDLAEGPVSTLCCFSFLRAGA